VESVEALDDIVAGQLDFDEMGHLLPESGHEIVELAPFRRLTAVRSELAARAGVETVVQGQLEDLGDVEIAGENIGLLAEGPGFDAA